MNKDASSLAVETGLRGGTDVTGFGLLGHALEMACASKVGLRIHVDQVPFVSGARKYADLGIFPGGMYDNRAYFGKDVHFEGTIPEPMQMLLFDPQTSGGLLLAVPRKKLPAFLERAEEMKQPAWIIGEAVKGEAIEVV